MTSLVLGVTTAGSASFYGAWGSIEYFVKTYKLSYSSDDITWSYVMQAGSDAVEMVFTGNTDASTHVTAMLPQPIATRYVRLHPQTYQGHMTTRWGVNGCVVGKCGGYSETFESWAPDEAVNLGQSPWNLKMMTSYAVSVQNTQQFSLALSTLVSNTFKLSLQRRKSLNFRSAR